MKLKRKRNQRQNLWHLSGGKCFWCGIAMVRQDGVDSQMHNAFTMDHHVPHSQLKRNKTGRQAIKNKVAACKQCNWLRGTQYDKYRRNPELLRYHRLFNQIMVNHNGGQEG